MKRVLLDVDGVLADFVSGTLCALRDLGGPALTPEHVTDWDIISCMPPEFGPPMIDRWRTQGFCASIPPYTEAIDAVRALREVADVVFVTAPMPKAPHWMWERDLWLQNYFGTGLRDTVFATAKHLIPGDMLVDDKVDNVVEWHEEYPGATAVLWSQPYNRAANVADSIVRANRWAQILEMARS